MKLIIVQPFGHRAGHYASETWQLADNLIEKQLNLAFVSFDGFINKNDGEIEQSGLDHLYFTKNAGFLKKLMVLGLIRFLSLINYNRLINRCLGLVETYFTVQTANKLYSDEDQDLIFCYDGELTGFLLNCVKTSNKQLIYGRLEYGRELPSNTIGRKIKRYVENWLCKKAISKNKIKFVTHMEDLDKLYANTGFLGECIYVPPFAIKKSNRIIDKQDARNFLNLPKDKTILLVFGIGHPGKSYETIVKAIRNLNTNCNVLFAGRSLPANDAKLLSKKYNCEENTIIFDKYISDTEHPYFYYAADYVILSYKKEFFEYSSVLLDSIKYGIPVIACDAFWIGKMVKTNGLGKTFSTEDPNSLEEAIRESLMLSEEKKDQIRKKMERLVEENSWENIADGYIALIEETAGTPIPRVSYVTSLQG